MDDEPANVELLKRLLERAGFTSLHSTNDPREAAPMFKALAPDLVLLDLHMPHMDGLQVIDELNALGHATYLPILMLTGDMTPEARREALSRGAKDFVNKPFHADEVLLRIRTLLETRFLYLQIQSQNQDARERRSRSAPRSSRRRRSRSSSGSRGPPSSATTTPASTPSGSARWRRCVAQEAGMAAGAGRR